MTWENVMSEAMEKIDIVKVNKNLAKNFACLRTSAKYTTRCAGTQPSDDKSLMQYVVYHLGLDGVEKDARGRLVGLSEGSEAHRAFQRIKEEELGETDDTPEDGELDTSKVYAVKCIRRDEYGPYILAHMVKGAIKVAASRLNLFVKKRGSKGDISEWGTIAASGASLRNPDHADRIYLVDEDGEPAKTTYETVHGTVQSTSGKVSIKTEVEMTLEDEPPLFHFDVTWPPNKLKEDDMAELIVGAGINGISGCRSLNYGRFEVQEMYKVKKTKIDL